MKKEFQMVAGIVLGGIFFVAGVYFLAENFRHAQRDLHAMGQVVDMVESRGRRGRLYFSPVIAFQTPDGREYRFDARLTDSSPPKIGASERVLYNPFQPSDARVDSPYSLYGLPAIMSVLGALLLYVYLLVPLLEKQGGKKKKTRLSSTGIPVQAKLTGMDQVGDREFVVLAELEDPLTKNMREVASAPLSFDPTEAMRGVETVTVYRNPSDPEDYWMDTSFLKKR